MMSAVPTTPAPWGATRDDWLTLDVIHGLCDDLLPVVSNPRAEISPDSKLAGLGKTPSRYNARGFVAGIADWTSYHASPADVDKWSRTPDYGICLQTRLVRGLDVDVPDPDLAARIQAAFVAALGLEDAVPVRGRQNSGKRLLAFRLRGTYTKRVLRLPDGAGLVEFLANGQQFVAVGTHPSGTRYEWQGGLSIEFPAVTHEQFERAWQALVTEFGGDAHEAKQREPRAAKIADAISDDPIAQRLYDRGLVLSEGRDGALNITCPWAHEHSEDGGSESATTYFPAHTGGFADGNFRCLHAHCEHRTVGDLEQELGLVVEMFDDLSDQTDGSEEGLGDKAEREGRRRFEFQQAEDFVKGKRGEYLIKGVLPQAALAVVFGASGSGKTFFVTDLVMAVARGSPWRGLRVRQGAVAYVCAEGVQGFRDRLLAYARQTPDAPLDLSTIPLHVLSAAPNLMSVPDVNDLTSAIERLGHISIVVVDTFSQVMPGANENAGEDVGRALAHCREIHKRTGALVILIHHSGKDRTRGARGWSGLRAAADVEIEVVRSADDRAAKVTKMKDGQDGADFGFKLVPVVLGLDEDQEPITSCIVRHNEDPTKHIRSRGRAKGCNEKALIRAYRELANDSTEVSESAVIKLAVESLNPPEKGKRDQREANLRRALTKLTSDGPFRQKNGVLFSDDPLE